MKSTLFARIAATFTGGLLLVLLVYLLDYRTTDLIVDSFREVARAEQMLYQQERVYSLLKDVHRARRGYIITGQEEFLEPYRQAKILLPPLLDNLRLPPADPAEWPEAAVQRQDLLRLDQSVGRQLAFADSTVARYARGQREQIPASVQEGKRLLEEAGWIIGRIQEREKKVLAVLSAQAERTTQRNHIIILTGMLLTGGLFTLALFQIYRDLKKRNELQKALSEANSELISANEELQAANEELQTANDYVNQVNQQLAHSQQVLQYREAQLLESQALTRTGSFDWDIAEDRIDYTPEYGKIFRLSPATAYRLNDFLALVHPDDRQLVQRAVSRTLEQGEPYQAEYRLVHPDETLQILAQGRLVYEREKPVRFWGTVVDVTAQRHYEETIRESEGRFRALLESAPDAMIVAGEDGMIQLVNSQTERLLGYTRGELLGQSIEMLLPEALRHGHRGHRGSYAGTPKVRTMGPGLDLKAVRKGGTEFPVEISLSPIRTQEGLLVAAAIRDVSERKAAEAQLQHYNEALQRANSALEQANAGLQRSNQDLEAFSYSVSHDLKTPLRSVLSFSGILEAEYADRLDGEGRRLLNIVITNARSMHQLIEALLEFARLGRLAVLKEEVDMQKMVETLLGELTASSAAPVRVQLDQLGPGRADRNLIRQVWYNLLSNAVKFSSREPQTRIHVGYRREPAEDIYYVEDNGVGFNPVYHDELFGVFKRLHGEDFSGTGVGLAICKRIISNHGGRIWAESKPGGGAAFYFTLPALLPEG